MKNLFFVLIILTTYTEIFAQQPIGIIRNLQDFANGSIEEYQEYHMTRHAMGSFVVVFKNDKGEKVKHKVDRRKMWGYVVSDERIFRVDESNNPCVIIVVGDIFVYGNYTTQIEDGEASMRVNQFRPQISKGIDGEMMALSKKNLKKLIPESSPYHEELKASRKYPVDLIDFVKYYNHEIAKTDESGKVGSN